MKKQVTILILLIIGVSCHQDGVKPEELSLVDQANETTQLFLPLGNAALNFYNNEQLRDKIYSEVDKKFDGDFNVLIQTIVESDVSMVARTESPGLFKSVDESLESSKKLKRSRLYTRKFLYLFMMN